MSIVGYLSSPSSIASNLNTQAGMAASITVPKVVSPPTYEGAYDVTPGDAAVTLETAGLVMARNVTINPIPSNYGRITWNGSTLTVS